VQDERYFAEEVAPWVDGDAVEFRGSVGPPERAEVLGSAAALLHPIAFDEPFGLSVVEAMACGTPVVAYRRGSMPEVVDEGITGQLAHDVPSAVAAVAAAVRLDRRAVRARAVARFGVDRMVTDYLRVYATLLA
jgi:glycosyltransferase involved in cell wall biosynthesis